MTRLTNKGTVSIIIPVFNGSNTIIRALESLAVQTYDSIEIIVVDNASTDETYQVCMEWSKFKQTPLRYYYTKEKGVSMARNIGLRKSQGEFIAFVDADDYVLPTFVETLVDLHMKFDCEIAVLKIQAVKEVGSPSDVEFSGVERIVSLGEIFYQTFISSDIGGFVGNKMYRSELFENIEFDESITLCEDQLLFFTCLAQGAIVSFTPKPLYYYIVSEGSASHDFEKSRNADGSSKYEAVAEAIINLFPRCPEFEQMIRARLFKMAVEDKKYLYELDRAKKKNYLPAVKRSLKKNLQSFKDCPFFESKLKYKYYFWYILAPVWTLKKVLRHK